MTKIKALIFLIFIWCFTPTLSMAAMVKNIKLAKYQPNVVRLVVELNEKTEVSIFKLTAPDRQVVDFKSAYFSKTAPSKIPSVDFIKSVRRGVPDKQTARLVLELPNNTVSENHFFLKPTKKTGWRFVMDLTASNEQQKSTNSSAEMKSIPVETTKTPPVPKPKPTQQITADKPVVIEYSTEEPVKKKSKKIIVLDPGHGGRDPGAISKSGKYEKHITLAMAKETREYLEDAGYKVVLTRSTDKAIPLRRRYQIAHEADGDLFISIHADSAKNKSARGLSIYTISERASDKEAAALAERENKADILLGLDLSDYNSDVSNILIDLAKIDTMNKSAGYAKHLVKEMKKETTLLPNAHRFAGFAVLKSANIPSVLLELGYLSNPREDKLLQKKSYRRKLAQALVRAVNKYFSEQSD